PRRVQSLQLVVAFQAVVQRLVEELQLLARVHAVEECDLLFRRLQSSGRLARLRGTVAEVAVQAELRIQAEAGHVQGAHQQADIPRLEPLDRLWRQAGRGQ